MASRRTSTWSGRTPRPSPRRCPYAGYAAEAERGDVLVYQFATASALAPWLQGRPEPLVVNYHNVTPPQLDAPWDNAMACHQLLAADAAAPAGAPDTLGIVVSAFNEAELREAGYRRTAVVPPAVIVPGRDRHRWLHRRRRRNGARGRTMGQRRPPRRTRASSSP